MTRDVAWFEIFAATMKAASEIAKTSKRKKIEKGPKVTRLILDVISKLNISLAELEPVYERYNSLSD